MKKDIWNKEASADSRFNHSIRCKALYEKIQCMELIVSLMIIGSNIVYIFQYSLEFDERDYEVSVALLAITLVMIILAGVLVVVSESFRLQYDQLVGKVVKGTSIFNSGRYKMLMLNLLVLGIQPYPFLVGKRFYYYTAIVDDYIYYHWNDLLNLLSTFRIMFAVGKLFYLSGWLSNSSSRVCDMYGCKSSILFAVKCLMKTNPMTLTTSLLLFTMFFFAKANLICEQPLDRLATSENNHDFWGSMWLVILTMTTGSPR